MSTDAEIAIVGAGVVGSATALALARRGITVALLEAEDEPGLAASGTNSGILHTGFDSYMDELETELILASAARRPPILEALGIPVLRCGALMRAGSAAGQVTEGARRNGVAVEQLDDGTVAIPGEAVTDPVRHTLALVAAAVRHGALLRTEWRVEAIEGAFELHSAGGETMRSRIVVNCAGLYADSIARMLGDDSFEIYPRKGEFFVFDPPDGTPLQRILLPVPSKRTKGVLVFPTIDGMVVAGPTAVDSDDKRDWTVRPEALTDVLPKAVAMYPPLEGAEAVAAYAGLRPAGRGVNYLIGASNSCRGLVNVAAIRSTGLTASLGIAERVVEIIAALGVALGPEAPLERGPPPVIAGAWWRRTAEYQAA